MFRGIVFYKSPIVLQGKCKKPVLNETPLIKWSLIILRLTHIPYTNIYIYIYISYLYIICVFAFFLGGGRVIRLEPRFPSIGRNQFRGTSPLSSSERRASAPGHAEELHHAVPARVEPLRGLPRMTRMTRMTRIRALPLDRFARDGSICWRFSLPVVVWK